MNIGTIKLNTNIQNNNKNIKIPTRLALQSIIIWASLNPQTWHGCYANVNPCSSLKQEMVTKAACSSQKKEMITMRDCTEDVVAGPSKLAFHPGLGVEGTFLSSSANMRKQQSTTRAAGPSSSAELV